jgi:large subunit ribosomal protein L13
MRRDYKSYYAKPADIEKKWILLDAKDQILGRLATKAADILRGKHKPMFTPGMDTGDFVVIINADKIKVTGKKEKQKKYYRHSGYPGGLKETSYEDMMAKSPEKVLLQAIKGMLPKNKMGRSLHSSVKIYTGESHPHSAQKPVRKMEAE